MQYDQIILNYMRQMIIFLYYEGHYNTHSLKIGADDQITDLAYSKSRQEFAYSSLDKQIYIRKFSVKPGQWKLLYVLQGICIGDFERVLLPSSVRYCVMISWPDVYLTSTSVTEAPES